MPAPCIRAYIQRLPALRRYADVRRGLLFWVTWGTLSCGNLLGIPSHEGLAPLDDGGAKCGIAFADSCRACAEAACCSEAALCAQSPACSALENCLSACNGNAACRSQCTVDKPVVTAAGIPAALESCLASNCEQACGLPCGGLAKLAGPDSAEACSACIQSRFCHEAQICAQSAECQRNFLCRENCVTGDCVGACSVAAGDVGAPLCLGQCGSTNCITTCSAGPDSGTAQYNNFYGPVSGQCQEECQAGSNWACVGHVQWPAAKALTRALTVGLIGIVSGQPRVGVQIKMCSAADVACVTPIDQQVTGSGGLARLVDNTGSLIGKAQGLQGYLDVASPELYPAILYWGFPLTEREGVLGTPLPVFSNEEWAAIPETEHLTIDPTRGHIGIVALDCLGNQASGVTFSARGIDDATTLLYAPGLVPNRSGPTDSTGVGFFVNVPVGNVEVSATPIRIGEVASRFSVFVRAGTMTEISLAPTPP